ncbi:hypothetical protein EDC63_10298 [Sulfurirhabdus autotrophica]|uniref:Uncharacterized protein n=1 Tax=Sulfurirhabdus autotrophica TaxID=1706046 RepID=A0A4R3YC71_9PROT|nr:hypothetical protein EDC63_10298 [Sulfurirhabdus autotrophica]
MLHAASPVRSFIGQTILMQQAAIDKASNHSLCI